MPNSDSASTIAFITEVIPPAHEGAEGAMGFALDAELGLVVSTSLAHVVVERAERSLGPPHVEDVGRDLGRAFARVPSRRDLAHASSQTSPTGARRCRRPSCAGRHPGRRGQEAARPAGQPV